LSILAPTNPRIAETDFRLSKIRATALVKGIAITSGHLLLIAASITQARKSLDLFEATTELHHYSFDDHLITTAH